jgi:hypothetical protein
MSRHQSSSRRTPLWDYSRGCLLRLLFLGADTVIMIDRRLCDHRTGDRHLRAQDLHDCSVTVLHAATV